MKSTFPEDVFLAAKEYLWLLSRGYPQKSSLKLVGDKFMLTRNMRQVLYRGISSGERADARKERIGSVSNRDVVLIDTYNVLFTVNNYLLGKPLFICNDGMLRDAGEMRGRIVNKPVFSRSVDLMLEILKEWPAATYVHYLDEPIPFSGRLSIELSKDMVQMGIEGEALTVKSPDQMLMNQPCDAICTSDTAIIDHSNCKVIDLPFFLLKKYFQTDFPSLSV
ncbi:MAG: DUF434 domain-containing protein [Bacteroidota bacterium]